MESGQTSLSPKGENIREIDVYIILDNNTIHKGRLEKWDRAEDGYDAEIISEGLVKQIEGRRIVDLLVDIKDLEFADNGRKQN